MDSIRQNGEMDEQEKGLVSRALKAKSVADVVEEVEVLIDMHHFNTFLETKGSLFLKRIIANQSTTEMSLLKKVWRTLNSPQKR